MFYLQGVVEFESGEGSPANTRKRYNKIFGLPNDVEDEVVSTCGKDIHINVLYMQKCTHNH